MRYLVFVVCCSAIGLLSACAVPSAEIRPITKIEARSISEQRLKSRVLAQLGSVLNEYPRPQQKGGPKNMLYDLFYWTVPRAGDTRNVCRYDDVRLLFAPEAGTQRNSESPVLVSGISVQPVFFLTGSVGIGDEGNLEKEERARYDRTCSKFTPDTVDPVLTEREDLLIQVAYRIRRLKTLSDEEFAAIEFECSQCAENVRSVNPAALDSVSPCAPDISNGNDANSVEADFIPESEVAPSFHLTYYRHRNSDLPYKIDYRDLIVLIHTRYD